MSEDGGENRLGFLAKPIKFLAEIPVAAFELTKEPLFYIKNNYTPDGFTYYDKFVKGEYPNILISYKLEAFDQKVELIDINTGKIAKEWLVDNKDLFHKAFNEDNPRKINVDYDLHFSHALMLEDSSLVLKASLTSLLARIDKNNQLVWLRNDMKYHHSLEVDDNEMIYACTTPFSSNRFDFLPSNYDSYKSIFIDDHITILDSENGDIIYNKSVTSILLENGYENLLLSKGQISSDPIHLNDIQPALTDTKYWNRGDLLLSCRNISTVFLYRPSTNKILWLKNTPWLNQHDVDFYENDKIVVFGNDVLTEMRLETPEFSDLIYFPKNREHNEIYIYDFETDTISTPYTKLMKNEKIDTETQGRSDILKNGDIYIEETRDGKIIIGDSINKKIEYVKRINENYITTLFWCRIIY